MTIKTLRLLLVEILSLRADLVSIRIKLMDKSDYTKATTCVVIANGCPSYFVNFISVYTTKKINEF